jgi:hypothetical protein
MKGRLVFGLAVIAGVLAITAATGLADPNLNLVTPHQHFLQQPDGTRVPIGPQICGNTDNLGLWKAFSEFHNNLHVATPGDAIGPAAPGLHDGQGGELKAAPCL